MGKITILDVAHSAGVSVATVDRVLNRRTGVRKVTVERVEAAIRQLNYQPDRLAARLARSRDYHFCFVLPTGNNTFMVSLGEEVHAAAERMAPERVVIDTRLTDVFDGNALAPSSPSIIQVCAKRSAGSLRAELLSSPSSPTYQARNACTMPASTTLPPGAPPQA